MLFAQRIATPSEENIAQAQALKDTYEEAKVVANYQQQHIRFFLNEKTQQINAEVINEQKLMALEGNYTHPVVQFFDETSSISDIQVLNRKGKKQKVTAKRTFYEQDGIFYSDAKVCYFPVHFSLLGMTYQVSLKKNYQDIRYFPSIYFPEVFPIQQATLKFSIPKSLDIELVERNFEGEDIQKTVRFDDKTQTNIITYQAKNLAPSQRESRSKGSSHLYPHLLILPKSYQKDNQTVNIFQNTQDLYNWYQSLVGSMKNDAAPMQQLAQELVKDATTDEEKVKAIYYWVQDNIRYIAFEDGIAGFKPDECQNVLDKKYGDCKGMANLTKELLKAAGLDARLTWIGTKRLAYDYSTPCLAVDNHMICTVVLDDKKYFLDATEEFNEFGTYAERIQGRQVLIEDGEKYMLENVPVIESKKNVRHFDQHFTLEDKILVGKGSYTFQGESKANFLYDLNSFGKSYEKDALQYYVTEDNKNYKATNIQASDISNRDDDMKLAFEVTWANTVSSFGDELYLGLDFERTFDQAKFKEERKQDYLFSHKIHELTTTHLEIPEGYEVSYLPKAVHIDEDYFSIHVAYTQKDNHLIYTKTVSIPKAEIRTTDFDIWNKAIDTLHKMHQEQVVLKKI